MNPIRGLPHHRLVAYQLATELLTVVRDAKIRDATLRAHALRSAKSACLNIAEAAARASQPDRARVFSIARGEAAEVVAAVEIAVVAGDARPDTLEEVMRVGDRLYATLTGLVR